MQQTPCRAYSNKNTGIKTGINTKTEAGVEPEMETEIKYIAIEVCSSCRSAAHTADSHRFSLVGRTGRTLACATGLAVTLLLGGIAAGAQESLFTNSSVVNSKQARVLGEQARSSMPPTIDTDKILTRYDLGKNRTGNATCQADIVSRVLPLGLRLGVALSPRLKFAGGVDYTLTGLSLGRNWRTRVDFDAIADVNFGGFSTLFPLTIDAIYHQGVPTGGGVYIGAGVGPYFGEVTRFGGKIVIGGNITPRLGVEGAIHFQGYGDSITTLQVRLPL